MDGEVPGWGPGGAVSGGAAISDRGGAWGGRPRTFHKAYIPYPPGYVRRDGKPPRGAGHPIDDVWNGSDSDRLDSIQIVSFSGEKVGYPTQKNESIVSRIVRAASSPGDLVLDCFVGSGTTAVVADKLGRRWIACDASPIAIHATRRRLLALADVRPFVVQSVGGAGTAGAARRGGEARKDAPERRGVRAPGRRRLSARVRVDGMRATIELASFAVPRGEVPARARESVTHWSQWLEGWCVDWDHRGGPLNAVSRAWRTRGQASLPLTSTHAYEHAGQYVALVKAFDVVGGVASATIAIEV